MPGDFDLNTSFSPIKNISDTARWVAAYRALESERPDALFQDPFARLLAGERGQEIFRAVCSGESDARLMAVRTRVLDEFILQAIKKEDVDTVLNLAAGLDTRPYRMPLSVSLQWLEVDLPEILSYKEQKLTSEQPVCALELVKLDLCERTSRNELFLQVNTGAKQVLVVTEGLLVYLTPMQVGSLAADLHAQSNFRWWLIDLPSPLSLKLLQMRWNKYLAVANARLQFAPEEVSEFFLPHGWRVVDVRPYLEEAYRLKREVPLVWISRLTARFPTKNLFEICGGIVLLERV